MSLIIPEVGGKGQPSPQRSQQQQPRTLPSPQRWSNNQGDHRGTPTWARTWDSTSNPASPGFGFSPISSEYVDETVSNLSETGQHGLRERSHTRFRPEGPQTHRLPFSLMLKITLLTSASMAIINFFTVWVISFGVQAKFRTMDFVITNVNVPIGVVVFVAICMSIASLGMYLTFTFAPTAGSSGAPENKGWLNGNDIDDVGKDYFSLNNLVVRQLATTCANMAGYPVGREGPTVTMGSNIAYLITQQMAGPHVKQVIKLRPKGHSPKVDQVGQEGDEQITKALLLDEAHLQHAQRIVCTVGGACGMSMLFDSPIGGIVYMFEEITSSSWPMELTMRAFVGTTFAALLSHLLLGMCGTDVHAFVIYDFYPQPDNWAWIDMPFFIILGAMVGPFSAFHTRACLFVGRTRQKFMQKCVQPRARIIEAVVYIAICAITCTLAAYHARCLENPVGSRLPEEGYVRFNCPANHYNPVASLILTTSEGAVKRLFSRSNVHTLHLGNECLAFVAYSLLNIGLTGVPVPSGNFTGSMLIGGLAGRILGALLEKAGVPGIAASGVYAMVGSAAMLCGFKQMCVAVVVFISHCANDLTLCLPLMVTVTMSLLLNRAINPKGFDEEQILAKNIPFLPGEPPEGIDKVTAMQLIDSLPNAAVLPQEAPISRVRQALNESKTNIFPVVKRSGVCMGFTTRDRLWAGIEAAEKTLNSRSLEQVEADVELKSELEEPDYFRRAISRSIAERSCSDLEGQDLGLAPDLPIFRLTDQAPYTLLKDMMGPRVYALFSKAGAKAACVVNEQGKYLGTISKPGLIKKTREIEEDLKLFLDRNTDEQRPRRLPLLREEGEQQEPPPEKDEERHEEVPPERPLHKLPTVTIFPATRGWSLASESQPLVSNEDLDPL